MTNEEFNERFRKRTRDFAVRILVLLSTIPHNSGSRIMAHQLGKSATSVGANFRVFCRARSKNERFAKICIVVEEADEAEYWLDLIAAMRYANQSEIDLLMKEALEILKIVAKIKSSLSK